MLPLTCGIGCFPLFSVVLYYFRSGSERVNEHSIERNPPRCHTEINTLSSTSSSRCAQVSEIGYAYWPFYNYKTCHGDAHLAAWA